MSSLCGKGLSLSQTIRDFYVPGIEEQQINVTQNVKVVFHRIENIVGKEENAGNQHFLLFPQCFQKAFSSSASNVVIVW